MLAAATALTAPTGAVYAFSVFLRPLETLLGLEIPKRAQYIRVIIAELARISDHLLCNGAVGLDTGAFTAFLYAFYQREVLYDIFETLCGARFTTSYTRVGGLMHDMTPLVVEKIRSFLKTFPKALNDIERLLILSGGDPDAMDSIVPMVFGNLALDLVLKNRHGRLVALRDGNYTDVALEVVTASKKLVNIDQFYDTARYRPKYENFANKPQFVLTSEG